MASVGAYGAPPRGHPAIRSRRRHELMVTGLTGGIPLAVALGIALKVPDPNFFLAAGILAGALGMFALAASTRYEVTLTILALYLGLVDGVVKLELVNQLVSSIRDIMIASICLGAVVRMVVRRDRVRLPPLSGWVVAFVVLTLVEAANPNTHGITKILGGFRQQLEWIPFFFFGYMLMRSKERFRKFFLLLGAIALVNGVVSTYQAQLSPPQLAQWGPGYSRLINGTGAVSARAYVDSAGESRVRPPALGSDMGFGGSMGVLALAGTLALLAIGGVRKRSTIALVLFAGALIAIVTSLARTDVLGGVLAVAAFALLSLNAGRKATRALGVLLVVGVISVLVIPILTSNIGSAVFSRYESISPGKAATTSVNYREKDLTQIPTDIKNYPFGAGLSIVGAGATFGGNAGAIVEGHLASAESQYNYVTLELGLPGLLLWVALSLKIITLVVRRLRRIEDIELRLSLAGVFATFIAFTIMGFVGPTMSSLPFGPYFWFSVGIAAYWFGRTGRDLGTAGLSVR
jgi:hypothetical protein